jgi:hypothetical protein
MQIATINRRELTMKGTAIQKLTRLAAVVAPAAAIAASCGAYYDYWSDENLKQQIRGIDRALDRIAQL